MTTPGNPFSPFNPQVRCPICGNGDWNIILESVCPHCGYKHQPSADKNTKGRIGEDLLVLDVNRGGMGEVFICKFADDAKLKVALKTFQMRLFFDKVSQDAFIREIINWMRLTGAPYIMPAISLEFFDGRPFVMMPAVKPDHNGRKTLQDYISQGALTTNKTLKYAFQIVTGMYVAQKNAPGFVHGDLKPANIFIYNDRVLISDFGLSRLVYESYSESGLESTYNYQAPECWTNAGNYSTLSDVYSFGVILYEMITGKLPFDAVSKEELRNAHLNLMPSFPQGFDKDYALYQLLELSLCCLKKNPNDRPSDFNVILEEIQKIGYNEDIGMQLELIMATFAWKEHWETQKKDHTKNMINALLKINRIDLALEELERIPPHMYDADLCALLGDALSIHNRDEEAIKYFEKALKYENLSAEKTSSYLIRMGLSLKRLRRYDEVIELYERLMTTVADSLLPQLVVNLATVYIASNKPREVVRLVVPFVMRNPEIPEAWANLGIAYTDLKQFDSAVRSFRKALDLAPQLAWVRLELARVLMDKLGSITDAIASLELAYGQGYDHPELYARLIQCYLYKRKFNEANRLLEEMQFKFGDHTSTKMTTSLFYRETGNLEKALKEIDLVLASCPYISDAHFIKSTILASCGDITGEIDCLKKALENNPEDGQAAANLTSSLLKVGRAEEAKKYGKIAERCGILPREIKKELGFNENREQIGLSDAGKENTTWLSLMINRLSLYCKNCPSFNDVEKLKALPIPIPANIDENVNTDDLFENVETTLQKSGDCPLPLLMAGIRFCSVGRFDLASAFWKKAYEKWPFMPDFQLGLGFIFEDMLQPELASNFFEIASKKGLSLDDKKIFETVGSLPCCNEIGRDKKA